MRSLDEIKERSGSAHLMIAKFGTDGEKTVCYQSMEDIPLLFALIESQKEEIERKDNALKILTDAMQSINDYSVERATKNTSYVALVDAIEALQEGKPNAQT